MILNIVDKSTFAYKDYMQVSAYATNLDSDYAGKSEIAVGIQPNAQEGDYVILMNGAERYTGIIDTLETENNKESYVISCMEMSRIFDQKIVLTNESILHNTGIEDFIANQIQANFISSADTRINKDYLSVICKTHTPIEAKPETENGIYNLCTYMGNALTNYGIFTDYEFSREGITITLEKKNLEVLQIDTKLSDVANIEEIYQIDALAKLTVLWAVNEETAPTTKQYFLKTDRTITTNMNDAERTDGKSDCVYITADTEAQMYEEVVNQFKSNSYQHKIEFDVIDDSKMIPSDALVVGHECIVKTSAGVKNSIISAISKASNQHHIHVELGQLKVTLLEKLKGR